MRPRAFIFKGAVLLICLYTLQRSNFSGWKRTQPILWMQTTETLSYWTKASPLRRLFHGRMEVNGKQLLHTAAVGNAHGAVCSLRAKAALANRDGAERKSRKPELRRERLSDRRTGV
jgi:hypothetical protein